MVGCAYSSRSNNTLFALRRPYPMHDVEVRRVGWLQVAEIGISPDYTRNLVTGKSWAAILRV